MARYVFNHSSGGKSTKIDADYRLNADHGPYCMAHDLQVFHLRFLKEDRSDKNLCSSKGNLDMIVY